MPAHAGARVGLVLTLSNKKIKQNYSLVVPSLVTPAARRPQTHAALDQMLPPMWARPARPEPKSGADTTRGCKPARPH